MLPELPNCALNCSDLHLPIRISEYLSILRSADKKCYRLKGDGNGDRVPLFSVWEVVHASIQLFFFFLTKSMYLQKDMKDICLGRKQEVKEEGNNTCKEVDVFTI